jgi:hypothetical protein
MTWHAADGLGGGGATQFTGTCEEFARALTSLGAGIEPDVRGLAGPEPRRVLLDCSYERWADVIGHVPATPQHFAPWGGLAFQTWEYHCADGPVQCIGRRHSNGSGMQYVSVRAVYFGKHHPTISHLA